MKYGDTLRQRSIPLWETCKELIHLPAPLPPYPPNSAVLIDRLAADNIDYNDIKRLIKLHTTNPNAHAQPTPIPGKGKGKGKTTSTDPSFEHDLEDELRSQHQRIDLFVQSKAGEIARRLRRSKEPIARTSQLTMIESISKNRLLSSKSAPLPRPTMPSQSVAWRSSQGWRKKY